MSQASPSGALPTTPLERAGKKKKVLILGAGLAGLSAGYELARAGHDVDILEARPRPGGRIETVRSPFAGGQYAEAGAMSFPSEHPLPGAYAQHFDLQLEAVDSSAGIMLSLRGETIQTFNAPDSSWPVQLSEKERKLGYIGMWKEYCAPGVRAIGDPREPGWPNEAARQYDQISWRRMLQEAGASDAAIEVLRVGLMDTWGDGINSVSALLLLRDRVLNSPRVTAHHGLKSGAAQPGRPLSGQEADSGSDALRICGGNDRLPAAFAATPELDGRVRYLCAVRGLKTEGDGFVATYSSALGTESLLSDYVVCTLPFSVLRGLDLDLPLSAEKLHWINWMGYTDVSRVFIQFKSHVWQGTQGAPVALSDGLTMLTQLQGPAKQGHPVILDNFVTGPRARTLGRMSERTRIAKVLDALEDMYPGAKNEFIVGAAKIWHQDPYAAGGYPYLRPGEVLASLPACRQSEVGGRLHFAGDHTSSLPGWMQGALESGQRAAREVNEAGSPA